MRNASHLSEIMLKSKDSTYKLKNVSFNEEQQRACCNKHFFSVNAATSIFRISGQWKLSQETNQKKLG